MSKIAMVVLVSLFAMGCAPVEPVISDINDSSLKVQSGLGTTDAMVMSKAREGCSLYNKTPVAISHQCLDQYCFRKSVLFACK